MRRSQVSGRRTIPDGRSIAGDIPPRDEPAAQEKQHQSPVAESHGEKTRIAAIPESRASEPLGAYRALAAVDYCNTIAGNVRALRALGAATITARPERLDRAVCDAYREHRQRRRV